MTAEQAQGATGFSGFPFDRMDAVRSDADAYAALRDDWRGRVLDLDGFEPRLTPDGMLGWTSLVEAGPDTDLVFLGTGDGTPHFAAISASPGPAAVMRSPAMFRALSMLQASEAAIFGTAISVLGWHAGHGFCGRCGSATAVFRAGWGRKCTACGTEHFPRTDPVVIMLAEYEGKVLVGRQSRFPAGNYSALAGFLEPGETIEEAVRRELLEESNIPTAAVRYVASQPWPFGGSQLMIACIAEATADAITIDTHELEDAKWVSRDDVQLALAGDPAASFKAPPPFAIAHSLFKAWLDEAV